MTKKTYLWELSWRLRLAGVRDFRDYISDYRELIEDRLANGEAEAAILADLGTPKQVVANIMTEEGLERRRWLTGPQLALVIVLVILGLPVWGGFALALLGILFALICVLLSLYVTLWAVPFSLAIMTVATLFAGVMGIPAGLVALGKSGLAYGLAELGAALICLGVFLLSLVLTWGLAKLLLRGTAWGWQMVLRWFCKQQPVAVNQTMPPFFNKGYWLVTALLIALGMLLVVSACGLNGWHIPAVSAAEMHHWYNAFNFTAPR